MTDLPSPELRFIPTTVEIQDFHPVRGYILYKRDDPSTLPPQPSDPPRIFVAGPQRIPYYGPDTFHELEFEFTKAEKRLRRAGYQGVYLRLVPVRVPDLGPNKQGLHLSPGGDGFVPKEIWQQEVRDRMKYCRGVALLDGWEDSPSVEFERDLAERKFGIPVRSLTQWTSRSP